MATVGALPNLPSPIAAPGSEVIFPAAEKVCEELPANWSFTLLALPGEGVPKEETVGALAPEGVREFTRVVERVESGCSERVTGARREPTRVGAAVEFHSEG